MLGPYADIRILALPFVKSKLCRYGISAGWRLVPFGCHTLQLGYRPRHTDGCESNYGNGFPIDIYHALILPRWLTTFSPVLAFWPAA